MPAPPRGRDHVTMTFLPAPGSVDVAEKVWLCQLSGNTSFVNRRVWIHGRRQKEEPTSERRRIVCGALRRPLRWLSGGAGPPAVTPHGVVGEPGGARRPESIESAAPTAKRVKLNTAHRSLVLLGHAERSAAQRRWVAGPRRRRRLARQEPSHKKKPWQHQKKPLFKPRRRITYNWTPSDPSLVQCAILWLHWRVRAAGEAGPCWPWIKHSDSRDMNAIVS